MSTANSPLPPDAIATMIAHMNEGHADAVLGYVHRLSSLPAAESARLIAIEPTHMLIHATIGGATTPLDVPFDHVLRDAADARDTLIAMARAGHDGSQTG